jgi:hypothetical protein
VPSDTYENDLDIVIELEAPTPGAAIYYTTDGDTPMTSDTAIVSLVRLSSDRSRWPASPRYADSHLSARRTTPGRCRRRALRRERTFLLSS